MAVANGRQRFHTKEKSGQKRTRRHFGDGVWLQQIQPGKGNIDQEVDAENNRGEGRPAQGQDQMVGIPKIELLGIELDQFEMPGPDPDLAGSSSHNG